MNLSHCCRKSVDTRAGGAGNRITPDERTLHRVRLHDARRMAPAARGARTDACAPTGVTSLRGAQSACMLVLTSSRWRASYRAPPDRRRNCAPRSPAAPPLESPPAAPPPSLRLGAFPPFAVRSDRARAQRRHRRACVQVHAGCSRTGLDRTLWVDGAMAGRGCCSTPFSVRRVLLGDVMPWRALSLVGSARVPGLKRDGHMRAVRAYRV